MDFDISVENFSGFPFLKVLDSRNGFYVWDPILELIFLFRPLSTLLPSVVLNMVLKVACLLILLILFIFYCWCFYFCVFQMCNFELGLLLWPKKHLPEIRLENCVWCVIILKQRGNLDIEGEKWRMMPPGSTVYNKHLIWHFLPGWDLI